MKKKNEKSSNELIKTFMQLVKISSPTGRVDEFRNFLKNAFLKEGFRGGKDKFGNLIFYTKKFDPEKSVVLSAHIDTVQPGENIKPQIKGKFIVSNGKTILAADPKAGIAVILETIRRIKKQDKKLENVEFIFSTNEEEGDHTLQFAKVKSKKAIVFDNSTWINEIMHQCPFAQVFLVETIGKEAYAQTHYDEGRNAVLALTEIINKTPWGYFKKNCVANTGVLKGGVSTTLVPPKAELKGNVYCLDKKDLDNYIDNLEKTCQKADKKFGTKTTVKILEKYVGSAKGLNRSLIEEIGPYYRKNKVKVGFAAKLLVGPDNCFAQKNIAAVNIGIGYQGCHTVFERLSISQLETLADILGDYIGDNYSK